MNKFNIRKLRTAWKEHGTTTKQIADLIGVNYATFAKKCNGNTGNGEITATQLAIICSHIGRNMEDFIDTEE